MTSTIVFIVGFLMLAASMETRYRLGITKSGVAMLLVGSALMIAGLLT